MVAGGCDPDAKLRSQTLSYNTMVWDWSDRLHSVLIFAIKLRQLLTGEGCVLLKIFGDSIKCSSWATAPEEVRSSRYKTPSLIRERRNCKKILDLTRKIIHVLTGEVPVRYEDFMVCFTMEEWEYVEKHKDLYKDVLLENTNPQFTGDQAINLISHNTSSKRINDSKPKDQDRNHVVEKIFHLTKEIIHLLTIEKYIIIWNPGNHTTPCGTDHVSSSRKPSLPSLIHKRKHGEKILELANKITELLTGETLIRYTDIKVCFSMEEWAYIEGHKDLYKDILHCEINESYDAFSSLDFNIKPLKWLDHDKDSSESFFALTHNRPHQMESTASSQDRPNIGKLKKDNQKQTPVSCCKCGKPLTRTEVRKMETDTADSGESRAFCRKCLLDKRPKDIKKKLFSCLDCGGSFSNKNSLKAHIKKHFSLENFQCSECNKVFTNTTALEIHMRVHTGEKPHKCLECGKCFSNSGNLHYHYRVHTGEKPFSCSDCDKTFRYKSHLVAHERFHTGQTLPCSECGKRFAYESLLVKHLRIHTGEKPFQCPECGKCYYRKAHLTQHMMIHTSESTFKCEECGRCFRFRSEFFRHKKTHTGEKTFSCSECGKSFTRSTGLHEHEKIHTGEKPYSCPKCGKLFVKYNYMRRHLRTHNLKTS